MSLRWPELMPDDTGSDNRRSARRVAGIALLSGAIAWTLVLVDVGLWGLAAGAALAAVAAGMAARLDPAMRPFQTIWFTVVGCILSWPLIGVLAVLVDYWTTGQTFGH